MPVMLSLSLLATALVLTACNKKESPATSSTDTTKPAEAVATNLTATGRNVAEEARSLIGDVKPTVEGVETNANAQIQTLMDRVKGLVAEKKYTEAMGSVSDLSKLKLTPDQQKWLEEIKARIQKAIADQATSDLPKPASGLRINQ